MPHVAKKHALKNVQGLVNSKTLGCNTFELEYEDGRKAIRYHKTDVITTFPNGKTVLDTGGWRTSTTKMRLNYKFNVWTDKGVWYIKEPATARVLPFFDGITFNKQGKVVGKIQAPDFEKIKAVKKNIAAYIKLVDKLESIPMPDSGDCWYCLMVTNEGKTWGDTSQDHSHLESHLEEGYIFGAIIYNALKEKGYQYPEVIMQMNCKTSIKFALRRYLNRRLLPTLQS
jgi:hypothetical protein